MIKRYVPKTRKGWWRASDIFAALLVAAVVILAILAEPFETEHEDVPVELAIEQLSDTIQTQQKQIEYLEQQVIGK